MKTFRTLVLTIAMLAMRVATAWDASTTFTSGLPTDITPTALAAGDAHGIWAAGLAGNSPLLVRYDTAGTAQFVRYVQNQFSPSYLTLASLPDGGVIVYDLDGFASKQCVLRRYDAAGNLRWTSSAPRSGGAAYYDQCDSIVIDGAGGIWVKSDYLYRLGSEGAIESKVSLDGVSISAFVGDPSGPNVYVVGYSGDPNSAAGTSALAEKISEHGTVLWSSPTPNAAGATQFNAAAAGADGSLYAFGLVTIDTANDGVYGVKLSPGGQLLWQHVDTSPTTTMLDAVAATPEGNVFVLFSQTTTDAAVATKTLAKTGANGAFVWTAATDLNNCFPSTQLRAAANGDAVLADWCQNSSGDATRLLRFSATGTRILSTVFTGAVPDNFQVLADSSSLLINSHDPQQTSNGIVGFPPTFERNAADGSVLPRPQTQHLAGALDNIGDVAFGSDGSAYLFVIDATNTHYEFSRIAPDGHIAWRQQAEGGWDNYGYSHRVVVTGDSACLIGTLGGAETATCYAVASGALAGSTQLENVSVTPEPVYTIARTLDSGRILMFYVGGDSLMHETQLTANSTVVHDAMPFDQGVFPNIISINGSGLSLVATGGSAYAEFAADGTRRYSQPGTGLGPVYQTYLAPDGTGLLLTMNGTVSQLSRIDASGAVSWTRAITQVPPNASEPYNFASSIQQSGNDVYLALGFRGEVFVGSDTLHHFPYVIEKISLSDGSVAWNAPFDGVLFNFPILRLDAAAKHLVAVSGWPNKLHTQVLDTANGNVLDDRFEGCNADICTLSGASLGNDGALRAIVDASSDGSGSFQRIFTRNAPFAAGAPIRLDQAGLDGAWFAPYASGQGFTLDYIASAKTLFMPWFTYTADGGNTPAALAWYALQGSIDAGATDADLAIAAADPSSFNAGAVGVHQVGSAHLSFSDCTAGTLSYRFNADVNAGASGLISLTRLTPSSNVCVLADGSTTPAQVADVPTQGFDASQSGSWFEPATSGQGLELTIVPPSAGNDGLVFAAWFTFDPANHSDDDAHQHWFTLQGNLAGASAGKVSLPILRTIGGRLDATPTGNTMQVGHAALTITSCDSAQLDYQFDDNDVAHAFASLSGSITLTKIGGCAVP